MMPLLRTWFLIAAFALLGGCATIDFDRPKTTTAAFNDTDDTYLGRGLAGLAEARPGQAGFYPVIDSIDALERHGKRAGSCDDQGAPNRFLASYERAFHAVLANKESILE